MDKLTDWFRIVGCYLERRHPRWATVHTATYYAVQAYIRQVASKPKATTVSNSTSCLDDTSMDTLNYPIQGLSIDMLRDMAARVNKWRIPPTAIMNGLMWYLYCPVTWVLGQKKIPWPKDAPPDWLPYRRFSMTSATDYD
jgi:hypothetical protein